jgi:hypothetical protein
LRTEVHSVERAAPVFPVSTSLKKSRVESVAIPNSPNKLTVALLALSDATEDRPD